VNPTALLQDPALQSRLNEDGFVTLPFLSEEELENLRAFYYAKHPDGEPPEKIEGIHMTTWCSDAGYKQEIAAFLNDFYAEPCARVFKDYRRLNNVFIVKESGKGTTFKVHQDWNVVDEKEHFAINIWLPLFDVDAQTGALWLLKGSHRIQRHVRGSAYLFPDYSPHYDLLEQAATALPLKAGEAVIFYLNAIHGSPPNMGSTPRIATCFSIIPKDAPLTIYFQKQAGDPLEVHTPPDDFMYHYTHLRTETFERAPSETPREILPSFENKPVSKTEIEQFIPVVPTEKKSWFSRLFQGA
jgi:hypothetical protein